ncbi:hypothetical protein KEJ44_08980 [Candidatus Bathyarchaeota archaeon]|nr:hypothetical protein [Candidatus Bathyarchaeota archaeon]
MAYTPWSGVTPGECKRYAQVSCDQLGFSTDVEFDAWINDVLIAEAEGVVESYCRRDFDVDYPEGAPEAVRTVIRRIVSNALQVAVLNRAGPLVRIGDWRVEWADRNIFPDDLKALLEPYVKRTRYVKATRYQTEEAKAAWGED